MEEDGHWTPHGKRSGVRNVNNRLQLQLEEDGDDGSTRQR